MLRNLVMFGHDVFELFEWTDKQTDILVTILHSPHRGKVTTTQQGNGAQQTLPTAPHARRPPVVYRTARTQYYAPGVLDRAHRCSETAAVASRRSITTTRCHRAYYTRI